MAVTSFKFFATITNDTSSGSGAAWTNPTNAGADDGSEATWSVSTIHTNPSQYLKCLDAGFTSGDIPSGSTIDGIEVVYQRREISGTDNVSTGRCRIVKGGTIHTANVSTMNTTEWATTVEDITEGGASNLWGLTWADTDIVGATTFGVAIAATGSGTTPDGRIDYVKIRVYYTASSPDATVNLVGVSSTGSPGTVTANGTAVTNLTGVSAAGSAGTVSTAVSTFLTGVAATGSPGSITATGTANTTLAGVSSAGSAGTITATAMATTALTGAAATGAAGDIHPSVSTFLVGVASSGAAGDVSANGTAVANLTGASATGSPGTVTASAADNATTTLTGVLSTGSPGVVTATGTAVGSLTGVAAAGGAGTITAIGAAQASITGVSATGQAGTVTANATAVANIAGVSASAQAGDIASSGTANTTLTGVGATGSAGTVTADAGSNVTTNLTGVESVGNAGTISATAEANVTLTGAESIGIAGTVTADNGVVQSGKSGVRRKRQSVAVKPKKRKKPEIYNARREAVIAERKFRARLKKLEPVFNTVDDSSLLKYSKDENVIDFAAQVDAETAKKAAAIATRKRNNNEAISLAILLLVA